MVFIEPVHDLLTAPPLGFIRRTLIPGVFAGSGDLTRPQAIPVPPFNNVNAYGLTWDIFTVPAEFGFILGSPLFYFERLVQLSTIHADAAGHQLVSEFHDFHVEGIYWLWANAGPTRVHYEIQTGVTLVLYWLTL
jgi:hypothetical protein